MKRVLVFLLLLAVGFAALQLAIGSEDFAKGERTPGPAATATAPQSGPGIPFQNKDTTIGVAQRGPFTVRPAGRTVQQGSAVLQLSSYELSCRDSVPLGDGVQQLEGVTTTFFDKGEPVADLHATRAFVELGADANGQPSLREDKEFELRDAVLTTRPGARIGPLTLTMPIVKARLREDDLELHTPTETDPVSLTIAGDRRADLNGKGMQARMPRDQHTASGRLDVAILHDPVFDSEQVHVTGSGRLHYVEQLADGSALLTVDRDVHALFRHGQALALGLGTPVAGTPATTGVEAVGDQLAGWLLRSHQGGGATPAHDALDWRLLRLDGAPAHVTGTGFALASPRVTVLPGPLGEAFLVTAAGAEPELVQTGPRPGATSTFRAHHHIHLIRPGADLGASLRGFGFPTWTTRPLQDLQIAVFADDTTVLGDDATLRAGRGMHVYAPSSRLGAAAMCARGFGPVHLERHQRGRLVVADGDDGFWLERAADPEGTDTRETLVLGPPEAAQARNHHWTIRRDDLDLHGRGACRFEREPDGRIQLHLRSVDDAIAGHLGKRGDIADAGTVDAELADDRLLAFGGGGPRASFTLRHGRQQLLARAPVVELVRDGVWRLRGRGDQLAHLLRDGFGADGAVQDQLDFAGPWIDVVRYGGRNALVEAFAIGDQRPALTVAAGRAGRPADGKTGNDALVQVQADHLRVLPFAVSPEVLDAHAQVLPRELRQVFDRDARRPWLFAEGNVVVEQREAGMVTMHGQGRTMVAAGGAEAGWLAGDPETGHLASLLRTESTGRVVEAYGPRVRFWHDDEDRTEVLTTFAGSATQYVPRVRLRDPRQRAAGGARDALADIGGSCHGAIEILPDRVLFHGPVAANSLLPGGDDDPDGMHIAAQTLVLVRDPKTGELQRVEAGDGVRLDWAGTQARCRELELDLRWKRCTARDDAGAELRLANGMVFHSRHLVGNYETWNVESWDGQVQQQTPGDGGRR